MRYMVGLGCLDTCVLAIQGLDPYMLAFTRKPKGIPVKGIMQCTHSWVSGLANPFVNVEKAHPNQCRASQFRYQVRNDCRLFVGLFEPSLPDLSGASARYLLLPFLYSLNDEYFPEDILFVTTIFLIIKRHVFLVASR